MIMFKESYSITIIFFCTSRLVNPNNLSLFRHDVVEVVEVLVLVVAISSIFISCISLVVGRVKWIEAA